MVTALPSSLICGSHYRHGCLKYVTLKVLFLLAIHHLTKTVEAQLH
jgi:hypothetical protein